jgi:surfeit locus 1 family protein
VVVDINALATNVKGFHLINWQYQFNWRISLFSIICVAVFVYLSLWQFERSDQKQRLQDDFDARRRAPPAELSELKMDPTVLNGQNVRLKGTYDVARSFLLDNRVVNGKVGFEVISPLITSAGPWDLVLVNRGWVEMGRTRDDPVDINVDGDEVDSTGSIYIPDGAMFSLDQEAPVEDWPAIIQQLDVSGMAARYADKVNVFPHIVRLDEGESGAYQRFWPILNMRPEKHTGYAVQWLLMAVAVVIAYGWASFTRKLTEDQDG